MSRSIKVHTSKISQNSKLETLLNSYTSLKSILSPNLSENNNIFMNSLFDLIISQLKIFLKLLSLKDEKKVFNIINSNNQDLSKQIAFLYELPKSLINTKISINSSSDKKVIDSDLKDLKKESYSSGKKNESFHINNSDNIEILDFNNNKTDSKENQIDNDNNNENNNNNKIYSERNKNNVIKIKQKNFNKFKDVNDKFIKIKTPEKNDLIKSLNFSSNKYSINTENKEKEKNIKVKRQKVLKKLVTNKEPSNEKESQIQQKKNNIPMRNYSKNKLITSKSAKYDFSNYKPKNSKKNIINKDKPKSIYKKISKQKEDNENTNFDNNKSEINIKNKTEKILLKSKTYIKQSMPLTNLLDISSLDKKVKENENNNEKYLSFTHSEKIIPIIKTPNDNNNLSSKQNNFKNMKKIRNKSTSANSSLKTVKNLKKNSKSTNKSEFFSLDEFLIPQTDEDGEKLFYTKKGKVLINKKQKDILEDYVNNYLFDEDDIKSPSTERKKLHSNKSVKELLNKNSNKNKNYVIKGTSTHYNTKDILEVLQLLPNSLNNPIDDYYLRKKRASLFDMGIFKICHNVIDNYKKLEGKGEYSYKKTNSNSQNKQK